MAVDTSEAGSGTAVPVSWNVCVTNDIVGTPPPTLPEKASKSFCTITLVSIVAKEPESTNCFGTSP